MENTEDTQNGQTAPVQTLGEYCKGLELPYINPLQGMAPRVVVPENQFCVIRVDGRAFHTFTHHFKSKESVFSEKIIGAMKAAAEALARELHPVVIYGQSDEITAVVAPGNAIFGGKCHKLNSIAAATATQAFNEYLAKEELRKVLDECDSVEFVKYHYDNLGRRSMNPGGKAALFDARTYGASRDDVLRILIWRQQDAIKNSISTVALSVFSHKALSGKNSDERISMLAGRGVDWHSYSMDCKYGFTLFNRTVEEPVDPEKLKKAGVAEQYIRRLVDSGASTVRRPILDYATLPPFKRIKNFDDVIFGQAEPILKEDA